jgi:RimJ/RimL family protein N-acetyltransferase
MAPSLVSERLYYKPLSLEHLSVSYVNWLNDPEVYKYLETGGDYTIEKLEQYLKKIEESEEILFWAIHIKTNNKHIGNIKIDPIDKKHGLGEYGIMIGDSVEWGKGYAKEASLRIIKYCFDELSLRKITLGVISENTVAVELYKSIGFEIEGLFKRQSYTNGRYYDDIRMAVFNPSFIY